MEKERPPSITRCMEIMQEEAMLDNIFRHSLMVARVAKTLLVELAAAGKTTPSVEEVIAGALLHDIAKTKCLNNSKRHAEEGYTVCVQRGYPQIAEIVREHVTLKYFNETDYREGVFGSKELVYYADKRVLHDQMVSLPERLEYIIKRYGDKNPKKETLIKKHFSTVTVFEQLLFGHLPFSAETLGQHLTDAHELYRHIGTTDR
ncbi:MAG: metal-dependent phosphohydrolase [Deltaproteobacteria bacterium]|nr:MAG: metal-dependent phosphohydrolase [Deltaproteobacteria bacterium]